MLLSACAHQDLVAAFRTQTGAIALRLQEKGGYFVEIGPHTELPLEGYATAQLESIWMAPSATLVVISGRTTDCPLRYSLVVAKVDGASITPIGDCGETYNFAQDGRIFVIRQVDAPEQRVWIFENGSLRGPMLVKAHIARHPLRAAPANPPNNAGNPMLPPQISVPVGNEVIPPPVNEPGPNVP